MQKQSIQAVFRVKAAIARPEFYKALEVQGVNCAIPPPSTPCLERGIAGSLTRPMGRLTTLALANLLGSSWGTNRCRPGSK